MEHDDELKIREKINGLDAAPIAWDKSLVWASIRFHGTRPSRRLIVYYAAASLMLGAAIVFYSIEQTYQETLRVRLGEIELALQQTHVPQPGHTTRTLLTEVPCQPSEAAESERTLVAQQRQANTSRKVHAYAQKEPPPTASIAPPAEKIVEPDIQSAIITPDPQIPKQPIAEAPVQVPVILGKSIIATSGRQDTRKGRLSLRLFRGEEEMPTTPAAAPVVTLASINNE